MCVCQCDVLVERYEEVIEDWYKGSQEEDLTTYLCEKHVLKGQDTGNAPPTSNKGFILFQSKPKTDFSDVWTKAQGG